MPINTITITAIEVLEYFCNRSRIMCPYGESSEDVFAAIRGICMGVGDSTGEKCLGDFPEFVQRTTPHEDQESWLESMRRLCVGMQWGETLDVVQGLVNDWKKSHPKLPDAVLLPPGDRHSFDVETFALIEDSFRKPNHYVPKAATLGEMLAFVVCYLATKWPPHGYTAGISDLNRHICDHFNRSHIYRMEMVLLEGLDQVPFGEACLSVADMVRAWRKDYRP